MKIILLAIILFVTIGADAQITKGSHFLGGDVSFASSSYKSNIPNDNCLYTKSSAINFSPTLGFVVSDNKVLGVRLILSSYKYDYNQSTPINHGNGNNIGASFFVRKYLPLGKSFYLFGDASAGGQSNYRKDISSNLPDYSHTEKGYSINATIYPGISYQIKKCLFLEIAFNNLVSVGYTRTNTEQQGQTVTNSKE